MVSCEFICVMEQILCVARDVCGQECGSKSAHTVCRYVGGIPPMASILMRVTSGRGYPVVETVAIAL